MALRPLPDDRRDALLRHMHRVIKSVAEDTAAALVAGTWKPVYPPNATLSGAQRSAATSLQDPALVGVLAAAIADAAGAAMFHTLTVVDAVGDPDDYPGLWLSIRLAESPHDDDEDDDVEMLHDLFFESWWSVQS